MRLVKIENNGINCWGVEQWFGDGLIHGFLGADYDCKEVMGDSLVDNAFIQSREGRDVALLGLKQTHGVKIVDLVEHSRDKISDLKQNPAQADGWIASFETLCSADCSIGIRTADCFPLLLISKDKKLAAALHCGWRSAVSQILPIAIEKLKAYGAFPSRLQMAVGPGAQVANYEIGQEVATELRKAAREFSRNSILGKEVQRRNNKFYGCIPSLLKQQAMAAGVLEENIACSDICTIEDEKFFSYRRQKDEAGRQISFIYC